MNKIIKVISLFVFFNNFFCAEKQEESVDKKLKAEKLLERIEEEKRKLSQDKIILETTITEIENEVRENYLKLNSINNEEERKKVFEEKCVPLSELLSKLVKLKWDLF